VHVFHIIRYMHCSNNNSDDNDDDGDDDDDDESSLNVNFSR